MKDGIYFNMPEKVYFEEKRLDATGIKQILESPTAYWFNSNNNPLYEEKKSTALIDGKIFHALLLEPENFKNKFKIAPEISKNSKDYKIWSMAQELPIVDKSRVKSFELIIEYLKQPGQVLYNDFLKNGFPEVSIFWTYKGTSVKSRIDYLTLGRIIDIKTYVKINSGNIDEYIKSYFYKYRIYIQMVFYYMAVEFACQNFDKAEGTARQNEFFRDLKKVKEYLTLLLFVNREIPQARVKTFTNNLCPDMWNLARKQIDKAVEIYKNFKDRLGLSAAWLEPVEVDNINFVDSDFPQSFKDILEVLE